MTRIELAEADEVFISASNKKIVPIIRVDDLIVGNGRPGAKTRQIITFFRDYTTAFGQGKI